MTVFGTRPEAIKMAPVIKQIEASLEFENIICVTAQHREMLDQVLNLFQITPHYDLDIMTPHQILPSLTAKILLELPEVMQEAKPDMVMVQGDTTTTFGAALTAFYHQIPVAHIEAGLRTSNKYSPYPEEINRRLTTSIADYHFAPTTKSKDNLIREGLPASTVFVTGNTVIDALKLVVEKHRDPSVSKTWHSYFKDKFNISFSGQKRTILVTGHRRENFGEKFEGICRALATIAEQNSEIQIVYPVHLNPNVQKPVYSILGSVENVFLIPPLDYEPFVFLMNKSYLILSDSGGVQEEAPFLGKPVLVTRDTTERPEGIEAGTAKLVGTDPSKLIETTKELLTNKSLYESISRAVNPYGDGTASAKILEVISNLT